MARMGKGREAWAASRARIQQGSVRLPRVAYGLSQSASEWHTQTLSKPASAPRKATARVDLAGPSSLEPSARAPGHSPRGAGLPNSMPTTPPGRTTSAGSDKAWPRAAARGRARRPLSARAASLRAARHDSSSGSASLDTRWCIDRSMPSNLSRRVPRARPLRARPTPPSGSTAHERWLRRALASSLLASCCPARGDGSVASNAKHCPAQ